MIYKLAETQEELEQAKICIYNSYLKQKLIQEGCDVNVNKREIFIACGHNGVCGTLSIIKDNLPMRKLFPEMDKYPVAAEAGGLAICEDVDFLKLIVKLISLVANSATKSGINYVVICTHPKHARFYKRIGGCEEFTSEIKISYLNNAPAIGLVFDIEKIRKEKPEIYGQFYS